LIAGTTIVPTGRNSTRPHEHSMASGIDGLGGEADPRACREYLRSLTTYDADGWIGRVLRSPPSGHRDISDELGRVAGTANMTSYLSAKFAINHRSTAGSGAGS
jgi:hypothetical protein